MKVFRRGKFFHYRGTDARTGERISGSTKETTRAGANAFMQAFMEELAKRKPQARKGKPPLLREAAALFLAAKRKQFDAGTLAWNTYRHYQNAWDAWLSGSALADVRVDGIAPSDVAAMEFPGGPFTRKNAQQALGAILKWCEEEGYLWAAPHFKSKRLHGRKVRITPEMRDRLMQHMDGDCRDVFVLMYEQLMRPVEVFAMRWEHIDWQGERYFVATSKTEAGKRWIPLTPLAVAVLKARYNLQRDRGTGSLPRVSREAVSGLIDGHEQRQSGPFAGSSPAPATNSEWVFPSRIHRVGHRKTIAKEFQAARQAAGIDASVKLYATRHTGASELAEKNVDLLTLRNLLGHEDISTTNKYLHGDAELARGSMSERRAKPKLVKEA